MPGAEIHSLYSRPLYILTSLAERRIGLIVKMIYFGLFVPFFCSTFLALYCVVLFNVDRNGGVRSGDEAVARKLTLT